MSALPHNQVGVKLELRATRNYIIVEFPTHVKIYLLMGELWKNKICKDHEVLLYSSPHDDTAHTAVQLQHNERFSNCVLLYWLYKLYCSDGWEKCTGVMAVVTEMMLQWHCLLNSAVCSTAIDCCSIFRHKLLDTERCVTSNTATTKEQPLTHSSGLCLHTASCNQLSATVQVSVCTQLHVTNSHPQFRSLSTHSFM